MGYKRSMRSAIAAVAIVLAAIATSACKRAPSAGPTDRAWTTADFQRVAAATDGCRALPAFGSAAFARMTDPGVLATIDPPERPLRERFEALMVYQEAVAAIFKRYATTCPEPRAPVAMGAVLIELTLRQMPLMDQFLAGFSPDDPTYANRAAGRAQVQDGLVTLVTGTAMTVRGTSFTAPLPGVGLRLGTALAQARAALPPSALAGTLGNLEAPDDAEDNPHRRALRADIRAGLNAPAPTP